MSSLLISTVLFLFVLLILFVARWKEINWLWKSLWGKVCLITLLVIYVLFNALDIIIKTNPRTPDIQSVLDSLNVKDKSIAKQIEQLSEKIDRYNDSLLARYEKFGPQPRTNSPRRDSTYPNLALSTLPKLTYLSEHDVAVVLKLSNLSNKPASIANFKSYLVNFDFKAPIHSSESPGSTGILKQSESKTATRIGKLRELPSYIDDYQIIIFVHSIVNVYEIKEYTMLYITSLNDKTFCESQSLPLRWTKDGMSEQSLYSKTICMYLDKHFSIKK